MTENHPNANICKRLRAIADLLERHPDIAACSAECHASEATNSIRVYDGEAGRIASREFVVAVDGGKVRKTYYDKIAWLTGNVGEVGVELILDREAVCRRVTKEVEVEATPEQIIPAKPAHTVKVYEWECEPILAR